MFQLSFALNPGRSNPFYRHLSSFVCYGELVVWLYHDPLFSALLKMTLSALP